MIHVATSGADTADGSETRPLQSLAAAQRRARELRAKSSDESITVKLAAGNYVLAEPLVLTPDDSGLSQEHPLTIAGTGDVRLSGGQRVDGFPVRDGHWVARVPESMPRFRDLWVNGRRAIRARSPNDGYYRIEAAGEDKRTSFVTQPNDLPTIANPKTAEVVYLHDWSISRVGSDSIDASTRTYRLVAPIGTKSSWSAICAFEPHPRFFVENAAELLDAPGEWFLDEAKRELHYVPRDGEKIGDVEAIVPRLQQLVTLQGTDDKPVEHICFDGIGFSHTAFDLPEQGYAEIQANCYARRQGEDDRERLFPPAAVTADRAKNCSFKNCRLEHLAAAGLHIAHSSNVCVERSTFTDLGGNGIVIGSPLNEADFPADGNVIENCLVERCGQTYFGAVGIWIGMAVNTVVRQNEVRDLPYTGISVGWCWDARPTICRGHQIRNNHIHHVMQRLSDGGGVYTLGWQPGTVIANNLIHDVPTNAGRAESNGMFIDQGSTDLEIENNTIYRVGRSAIRFNMAGKNTVAHNRLALVPGTPTFFYTETKADDMSYVENEVIEDAAWQPPVGDAAVKSAGPQGEKAP